MTPSAVRMVLVEGENADGRSLDHDAFDISAAGLAATSAAPQQVIDAILGTQESALEGGHRLTSVGIAWTDHAAAGKLRDLLRSHRFEDVVMVSELHAASALAQAIGQTVGSERTALLFVERETATLAVVRATDGAVVRVMSRNLLGADIASELRAMVTGLDSGPEPAQAVYVVGSGVDVAALEAEIASVTSLPVHAPQDGDLALARGAALASARTPRYEASTVGLASTEDTAAGATQMAAAGYMAPLGYSAVSDCDDDDIVPFGGAYEDDSEPPAEPDQPSLKSFALVGGALSGVFVVGVAALAVTLAVVIRPTADQRPAPGGSPVVSSAPAAVPAQAEAVAPPAAPETIQAPIPVVQEAPRTVVVAPAAPPPPPVAAPAPAPAPAAPAPAPEPAPAPPPPPPPPPAPSPAPPPPAAAPIPAAPAPAPPPVIVPVPIVIPPIFQPQVPRIPTPRIPSSTATYPTSITPANPTYTTPAYTTPASPPPARTPYATSTPPVTTYPQYPAYPTTTVAPSAGSGSSGSGSSSSSGSGDDESSGSYSGGSTRSQNPLWPLWPFG